MNFLRQATLMKHVAACPISISVSIVTLPALVLAARLSRSCSLNDLFAGPRPEPVEFTPTPSGNELHASLGGDALLGL